MKEIQEQIEDIISRYKYIRENDKPIEYFMELELLKSKRRQLRIDKLNSLCSPNKSNWLEKVKYRIEHREEIKLENKKKLEIIKNKYKDE